MSKKYALITGATQGIGFELAKVFAKNGYNLILVARSQQELHSKASDIKQNSKTEVITISKDLFKKESAEEIYRDLKNQNIQIDVLVNNAGQGQYGLFVDNELNREFDIINLNICSTIALTKYFLKDMVARNDGKILNLSSVASKAPGPYQAVYHGTKAFVQSWTEALRSEVKETSPGITITALLPGATDTDFFNKADMKSSKIVQGKLDDPAKVAQDGYEALMNGDDMVVSGIKNKIMTAGMSLIPDAQAADLMKKQQEPVTK